MIIIGDVHGDLRSIVATIERLGIYGQNLIQVGDVGLGFMSKERDFSNLEIINEIMIERRCMLYLIRGNHDNPSFWNKENDIYSNVILVPDYSLLEIDSKKVFFLGGAISIDRLNRVEGINYWKDEIVILDMDKAQLAKEADIIITHISPSICFPHSLNALVNEYINAEKKAGVSTSLANELTLERGIMDVIRNISPAKEWYYGHYHRNNVEIIDDKKYVCVDILQMYDTIKEDYINKY